MNKSLRKIVLAGFVFIPGKFLHAQNLVPNPSFEDTSQCPNGISQLSFAIGWYSPSSASPDYCNSCSNNSAVSVPQNIMGWEYPRTGAGYAGIFTAGAPSPDYREYLQTKLLDTLVAGKVYYISFYTSLSDSCVYGCNSIGIYLSQTQVNSTSGLVLPYNPQIANASSNPLISKSGWTLVGDTITALGGELYITIGNFINAANNDTVFVGGGAGGAAPYYNSTYYYIDDVSVELDHSGGQGINGNGHEVPFAVYPNPGNGLFQIKWLGATGNASTIEVYNVLGEKVHSSQVDNSASLKIDLSSQTNGVYFLQLKSNEGMFARKIVIQK